MTLNREDYDNLLKEIAETGGPTDKMMELLQRLRDDFDAREGELRARGEERDKRDSETRSTEDKIVEEAKRDNREDGGLRRDPIEGYVRQEEYDALKRRYIDRFFGGRRAADEEQVSDSPVSAKINGVDDLFEGRK